MTKGRNMDQITITEAEQQLQVHADEVARIRAKIRELRDGDNAVDRSRLEREAAKALLEGGDVAEIVAPSMTSAQLRRAVAVLEGALGEALEREAQARGVLRAAKVRKIRELLDVAKERYDQAAVELLARYCEATAMAQSLAAAVGGVEQMPLAWHRLELPRAIPPRSVGFFDSGLYPRGSDNNSSDFMNRAKSEVQAVLRKEGIGK